MHVRLTPWGGSAPPLVSLVPPGGAAGVSHAMNLQPHTDPPQDAALSHQSASIGGVLPTRSATRSGSTQGAEPNPPLQGSPAQALIHSHPPPIHTDPPMRETCEWACHSFG